MKNININMVDLMGQYSKIKNEIDRNIISSIESGRFVNGPIVKEFSENLSDYFKDETVLIVTHRMAPLTLVDRIIVLDNGRVAIDGPRDLVIQKLQAKKTA